MHKRKVHKKLYLREDYGSFVPSLRLKNSFLTMYMVFFKMSIKSCPWKIFNNQEKSACDVILKKKKKKGPNTPIIIMLKNMLIRSLQGDMAKHW